MKKCNDSKNEKCSIADFTTDIDEYCTSNYNAGIVMFVKGVKKMEEKIANRLNNFKENHSAEKVENYKIVVDELKKFGWEVSYYEFDIIKALDLTMKNYNCKSLNRDEYVRKINEIMINYVDEVVKDDSIFNSLAYFSEIQPLRQLELKRAHNYYLIGNYNDCILILLKELEMIKKQMLEIDIHTNMYSARWYENKVANAINDRHKKFDNFEAYSRFIEANLYPYKLIDVSLSANTNKIDNLYQKKEIHSKFSRHAVYHGIDVNYGAKENACKCLSHIIVLEKNKFNIALINNVDFENVD